MNETRKMGMGVRIFTLLLCTAGCVVCTILLPGAWKSGVMGTLIGPLTGIMSFNIIQSIVRHIDGELADIRSHALRPYTRRYMLYATISALNATAGAHIAALLVGMLLHKCSILIYSWKHRKRDE